MITRNETEAIYKTIGILNNIRIGDILEFMNNKREVFQLKTLVTLMERWGECGFHKGLQELVNESGWEEGECIDSECRCGTFPLHNDKCPFKSRLRSKEVENLFIFLKELFL